MEQQESSQGQSEASAGGFGKELKDQVTEQAQGLAEQAQEAAESQKGRLADGATGIARALHHASAGLREDDQQTVGDYTEALATKVDQVAQFLQSRDLPTMAREVSSFARRQPALFLGGAFTLGMVAARFLKSSGGGSGQNGGRGNGGSDDRDHARGSHSGSSERATDPAGNYGPAPAGYAGTERSAEEEVDNTHPDPALSSPGGVPPLPTAAGGGL